MAILGKNYNPEQLLGSLSPKVLPLLVRDILVIRKHLQVSIVDGPGDGKRDIHSCNKEGDNFITQCKHHQDILKTCTSSELGELPLALTKFGHKKGLFVTNARISPQAKREYLSDFPGFELEFLDGQDLAKEVLNNSLLSAAWFSGESIKKVNFTYSVSFIIRELSHNLGVQLDDQKLNKLNLKLRKTSQGDSQFPRFQISKPSMMSAIAFEPFNQPSILSLHDGGTPWVFPLRLAIINPESIYSIGGIDRLYSFTEKLSPILRNVLYPEIVFFSIRFGIEQFTPLEGFQSGNSIQNENKAITFTISPNAILPETEWYSIKKLIEWQEKSDANSTDIPYIRLYSTTANTCLSITLKSKSSVNALLHEESERRHYEEAWINSVHLLIENLDSLPNSIPPPDEMAPWYEGKTFASWLHPNLLGYGRLVKSTYSIKEAKSILKDRGQTKIRFSEIRTILLEKGFEILSPEIARHMLAICSGNDFFDFSRKEFLTADLIDFYPEIIPSPINPRNFQFHFTTCWKTDTSDLNSNKHQPSILREIIKKNIPKEIYQKSEIEFLREKEDSLDGYFSLTLKITDYDKVTLKMAERISEIAKPALKLFEKVELELSKLAIFRRRATKEFWQKFYHINLSPSEGGPIKHYIFSRDQSGKLLGKRDFEGEWEEIDEN